MWRRGLVKIAPYIVLVGLGWVVWVKMLAPRYRWRQQPPVKLRLLVVDYTVPYDDYRKHRGLFWLLSHFKVTPPDGDEWDVTRHYIGYDPLNRDFPRRLASRRQWGYDLLYIVDTYGVYEADVAGAAQRKPRHLDHSRLVFGGLVEADAAAAASHTRRGRPLIVEFNSFCLPTEDQPRAQMERLLGVRWTGWVGRTLINPRDEDDVPSWLPRLFAKRYPGREYPHDPVLALIHRSGKLLFLTGKNALAVTPRVGLTGLGNLRFRATRGDVPYPHWFALVEALEGTAVHAELELPTAGPNAGLLQQAQIPSRVPLLTERRDHGTFQIYLAADFADPDFELPSFRKSGEIEARGRWRRSFEGKSAEDGFWRFYAPTIRQLIGEALPVRPR